MTKEESNKLQMFIFKIALVIGLVSWKMNTKEEKDILYKPIESMGRIPEGAILTLEVPSLGTKRKKKKRLKR